MFGRSKERGPQSRIDSLIGAGTRIEGTVYFAGGLRIDGEVKGSVLAVDSASAATLVLSEQARIEGGVTVAHLVTNGTIAGPVSVAGSLEMQSRARIVGDVEYVSIEMHLGAVIEGRMLHGANKSVELVAPLDN